MGKENTKQFLDLAGAWKDYADIDGIFKNVLDYRMEVKFRY